MFFEPNDESCERFVVTVGVERPAHWFNYCDSLRRVHSHSSTTGNSEENIGYTVCVGYKKLGKKFIRRIDLGRI